MLGSPSLGGCFLLFLLAGPLIFPDSPESLVCPVHDQQLKSSPEHQEVDRHEGSYISIHLHVIFSITAHLLFLPSPPRRSIFPWFEVNFYFRLLILSLCFPSSLYVIDWSLSAFSPLCLLCKSVLWRLKIFEPLILKQRSLSHGSVYLSSYSQLLVLVCSSSLSSCPTLTIPSTSIRSLLPPSLSPNIYLNQPLQRSTHMVLTTSCLGNDPKSLSPGLFQLCILRGNKGYFSEPQSNVPNPTLISSLIFSLFPPLLTLFPLFLTGFSISVNGNFAIPAS